VAVVVVNYRRYDLLGDCLRSVRVSSRPPDRIIVVDNESDPDDLARVIGDATDVVAIANPDNRGYAAACNQGWRAAGTETVLFLNGDITLDPDCMARCLAVIQASPDVGIVTARLVRPDGRMDHACHRGLPTPGAALWYSLGLHRRRPTSHRFARYTMSWLDPHTEHDVEACSGAFLMTRMSVLERLSGWDERYWFYAEDLDLCLRVRNEGKRVRYVGDATAIHVKGASSALRRPDAELDDRQRETKRRVQRAIITSHRRFFHQHLEAEVPRPLRPLIGLLFQLQELRLRWSSGRT